MIESWNLWVPGHPKPQARPRVGAGRTFSPKTPWWNAVYLSARANRPLLPITGPLFVRINFYFPGKGGEELPTWKTTRPDSDNLEKAVWDAMQAALWFLDDAQIVSSRTMKLFCGGVICKKPGASITMERAVLVGQAGA